MFLLDEQEVGIGGAAQHSHVEVPAGDSEFYFILVIYILTFQAGLVVNEVDFIVEAPDDKPQALAREHFYFPLGLWVAGLAISAIFLLAEIIIKWRENKQERR